MNGLDSMWIIFCHSLINDNSSHQEWESWVFGITTRPPPSPWDTLPSPFNTRSVQLDNSSTFAQNASHFTNTSTQSGSDLSYALAQWVSTFFSPFPTSGIFSMIVAPFPFSSTSPTNDRNKTALH